MRKFLAASLSVVLFAGTFPAPARAAEPATATPIKHLVVIFGENVSFDHYFGTYPTALNKSGETPFTAAAGTPMVNDLLTPLDMFSTTFPVITTPNLLTNNPNSATGSGAAFNGANAANPFRLYPSQAATADQNHSAKPEQTAYHLGLIDQFPGSTGAAGPPPSAVSGDNGSELTKGLVMGYFDGNTVTAMWNYAQNFVLFDNNYTSQFGPSSPGAINLISGQTNGINVANTKGLIGSSGTSLSTSTLAPDGNGGFTQVGDADPWGDVCSSTTTQVQHTGKNIGDLLNAKNISWGWFQGGFDLQTVNPNTSTNCLRSSTPLVTDLSETTNDYIPHHEPFQYYASTANPTHARPAPGSIVGNTFEADGVTRDPANHQYDTADFTNALNNGILPAVSFIKAPGIGDGHPGYSDPTDEQAFVVNTVNAIMASPFWDSTAIIITYDDSDGWYDHQMPPIVNPSTSTFVDTLNGPASCTFGIQQWRIPHTAPQLTDPTGSYTPQGRCGYGTRVPMLLISPYAQANVVDHSLTDQSSVLAAIEDNWLGGERITGSFDKLAGSLTHKLNLGTALTPAQAASRKLILSPTTGALPPTP
jgi:phospholipase C